MEILVRVTFYTLVGITSSGFHTGPGVAACSDWIPLGTAVDFGDHTRVYCYDRGLGSRYWNAWIDVWAPNYSWGVSNVVRKYGDYTWVTLDSGEPSDSITDN